MLIVLLLMGVYIAVALAFVGFGGTIALYLMRSGDFSRSFTMGASLLNSTFFTTASEYTFVVLPLFILMGLLAAEGGLSYAGYATLSKWVGGLPGGLGIATIGAQTGFGTCTGSSLVTSLVFTKVSAPEMIRYGYSKKFTYGLISAGGSIGMLVPPSVLAVIYALLANESVGKLLIGGVGPGFTLAMLFSIGIIIMAKVNPTLAPPVKRVYSWREKLIAIKDIWTIFVVAFLVIGGIMLGVFTATEAGAVGSSIVLVVGLVTRKLAINFLPRILREAAESTAMVFLIFISAQLFSRFLSLSGASKAVMIGISELNISPLMIVLGFVLLYFILGMFLDGPSMLATTVPIVHPIVVNLGLDPIWFAMTAIMAIECGLLTPPVGLNVYAVKGAAGSDISLEDIFRGSFPFFLIMILNLALIFIFPEIATFLPSLTVK